jgi:shikimate dehydrogenase
MDDISDRARRSGSVNIVRRDADGRLIGDMTDGLAFVEALRRNDVPLAGASAVVVGAGGGAGAAIADSLCAAGLAEIALVDTDPARSQAVTDTLRAAYPDVAVSDAPVAGRRYDLAVNATPLGMRPGDPLPFDVAITADDGVVADVVTKPEMTALILAARRTGRRVQTGIQMADAQLEFQMRHLGLSRGDATLSPVSKRGRMP